MKDNPEPKIDTLITYLKEVVKAIGIENDYQGEDFDEFFFQVIWSNVVLNEIKDQAQFVANNYRDGDFSSREAEWEKIRKMWGIKRDGSDAVEKITGRKKK